MQTGPIVLATAAIVGGAPGSPKRWGSPAVQPMPVTRRPNAVTSGVMPGTSDITIIAGPDPILYTSRVFLS